jgi:hypothetical protein
VLKKKRNSVASHSTNSIGCVHTVHRESVMSVIMPETNGVPNMEIRRIQKALLKERAQQRGVHQKTADEISKDLDQLRAMADRGELRALVVVALLRPSAELPEVSGSLTVAVAPMVKTLFACPRTDRPMALDLARMTDAYLQFVMAHEFPPDPPPKAA